MKKAHLSQGESEGGEVGVQQYSPCRVSCHWWKKQHQQQGRGKQLISVFSDKPNQKKTKTNKKKNKNKLQSLLFLYPSFMDQCCCCCDYFPHTRVNINTPRNPVQKDLTVPPALKLFFFDVHNQHKQSSQRRQTVCVCAP